jgi:hypothetical protein
MTDVSIEFHPLTFVAEGADVVVGRAETGSYAVLPKDGAELLQCLRSGMTAAEAAEWYEQSFGEPVDIDDFLESMKELGFIQPPGTAQALPALAPPRFQWLGKALFSVPAWFVYAALVTGAVIGLIAHTNLRPTSSQVYFTGSLVTVQVLLMAGQIPLAFLHESYHVLAGQRLGLRSRLGISNRYTYVVFETISNGLFSVPRRKRYLPILAGILVDIAVVCALDLTAAALRHGDGAIPFAGRLCLALSYSVLARLCWQFLLHLRTDLYYVLSTALNCYDLHEASRSIFFNRLRRLTGRTARMVDETQWTDRDRKIGAWYGWVIVFGFLATVVMTAFVTGPVGFIYVKRLAHGLAAGVGTWRFSDSLFSLALIALQFVLPIYLARRKRRRATRRKPRLLTV